MRNHKLVLKFKNLYQIIIWAVLLIMSIFSALFILLDVDKPSTYFMLFLLPLTFFALSIICSRVYTYFFDNIGITLLIMFIFIRTVISPLLMSMYGYTTSVVDQGTEKMSQAVLLVVYEMICVFLIMIITMNKMQSEVGMVASNERYIKRKYTDRVYGWILLLAIIILVGCAMIAPELFLGYRFITQIGEDNFAAYEDTMLIRKYGTTLLMKFALVTGNYLMRVLVAIVPGFLIVKLSEKKVLIRQILAFCCCFLPLLFIGGVIARSLIYIVCLLLLYFYLYYPNDVSRKMVRILCVASVTIIVWWGFISGDKYGLKNISSRLLAYFSGINNVCGSLNLEGDIHERILYFITDYTNSIPYGGTIFANSHETMTEFFNNANGVRGQIPTTIGTGMYYFGPIFAPVYSCLFTFFSIKEADKIKGNINSNPLRIIRLLLTAMYFAMGVVMYNISITLTNCFSILLPMYLMERMAYKKG